MKHIILAKNICIAKDGLKDIIKNLDILNNSNIKNSLDTTYIKTTSLYYFEQLSKDSITISNVDEILDFIEKKNKAIFDIFS